MNLTYEQAVQHQIRHGFMVDEPILPKETSGGKLRRSRQPNKTEVEFGLMLEARRHKGEFLIVEFEAVKLKVGDGTYYTPDWICQSRYARPVIFEVKGKHRWDDAIVKYKAAKERYSWADFEMWEKTSDGWKRIG